MSVAEQLAAIAAAPTDTLKESPQPANFTKLPWASTAGSWTTSGWKPPGFTEGIEAGSAGAAYYNTAKQKAPAAAMVIHASGSDPEKRQWSAWAMASASAKPTGYQAVAVGVTGEEHKVLIREWNAGVLVRSAEAAGITLSNVNSGIAVVVGEGKAAVWTRKSGTEPWVERASIETTSFSEGFSGFDGNGSNPLMLNFATAPVVFAVSGAASGSLGLAGKAAGVLSSLSGKASGALGIGGQATGFIPVAGAAKGSLGITATAIGEIRHGVEAEAKGSIGLRGTAAGVEVPVREGSAAGRLAIAGAAAGIEVKVARGRAEGALALTGTAAGLDFPSHQKIVLNFSLAPTRVAYEK